MANIFRRDSPDFDPLRGFKHGEPLTGKEAMRGHPTAPGPRDAFRNRVGLESPGNGVPGLPRLIMGPMSHGPGIPGQSPAGPTQPDVLYNGKKSSQD